MPRSYQLKDVLIDIKDVSLSYDGKPVLNRINATVRDIVCAGCVTGQVIGILGPSGIGKTQLSRILTGLQPPDSGVVTVGTKTTPLEAGVVGYVQQSYPLLRHRTVLENLVIPAQNSGNDLKTATARSLDYLQRFGLGDKVRAYPTQLSGGQRQRVAIAAQLLCSEHFLVLDEPTTGLDPVMKDRVCDFIKQVAGLSEENTIFVVSHDIQAICTIADTLWLLGRTRDEQGNSLGASIVKQYNLIDRGIAWEPNPQALPQFSDLVREVRNAFETL
jgi:ABC-type polar amino acid transport system ATPase subunit